jgi:hypothetical protein
MKNILYLTFYFEPDLCAGSFRNTPLIKELALKAKGKAKIEVITTFPNRYDTYKVEAKKNETLENLEIHRIVLPAHQSGMKDQIMSFKEYYFKALQITKNKKYDLVIASSSRLFTAFLGYKIAFAQKVPLYLDIRDIFYDTMEDVLKNKIIKAFSLPVIKYIEKKTFNYAAHINLISGGFKTYFEQYKRPNYSYFTNGIDQIFINNNAVLTESKLSLKKIVYAGNVGEGQGLEKIIPEAALRLGTEFQFLIIGDGGTKERLTEKVNEYSLTNVIMMRPMERKELLKVYEECDFTFVHLNDYDAFKKVLPSKIFELACFPQPLIAGVGGYSYKFISENVDNRILFNPCDVDSLVTQLKSFNYKKEKRSEFIKKFNRTVINSQMAETMLEYI